MKKIYVITAGEYSSYNIVGATTDLQKAFAIARKESADAWCNLRIEVFDEPDVEISPDLFAYFVEQNNLGVIKCTKIDENNVDFAEYFTFPRILRNDPHPVFKYSVFAKTEQEATDMAVKKVYQSAEYKKYEEEALDLMKAEEKIRNVYEYHKIQTEKGLKLYRIWIDQKSKIFGCPIDIHSEFILGYSVRTIVESVDLNGKFFVNGAGLETFLIDVYAPDQPTAAKIAEEKRTVALAEREGLT